jgi:hypothetical protein
MKSIRTSRRKICSALGLVATMLSGCGGTSLGNYVTSLTDATRMLVGSSVTFVHAPVNMAIANDRRLNIAAANQGSESLARAARTQMTAIHVNGEPFFTHSPPDASVEINFRLLSKTPGTRHSTVTRCSNRKDKCKSDELRQVNCTVNRITMRGESSITRSKSGQVIATESAEYSVDDKGCTDGQPKFTAKSHQLLEEDAATVLVDMLVGPYAPKQSKKPLELVDRPAGLGAAETERAMAAYQLAKSGDVAGAAGEYQSLSALYGASGELAFNAAFLQHALGNYAEAVRLYDLASTAGGPADMVARYRPDAQSQVELGIATLTR